jgi:hypothetical protein
VVCYVVEVEDGSLLVTLLQPAGLEGEILRDYRPVIFDAQGRRHLPRWERRAPRVKEFGARMPINHYRLSRDIPRAGAVVSLGVERMMPTTLRSVQQEPGTTDRRLPVLDPAVADRGAFETAPGSSWQIAPFPMGDDDWTRWSDGNICCDVVKSRDGGLAIYLACRRSGGGCLDANQYRPALFDARRCRLWQGPGLSQWVSTLLDDPSSTGIATGFHWIAGANEVRGVVRIPRSAAEIAFVGIEGMKPAVPQPAGR